MKNEKQEYLNPDYIYIPFTKNIKKKIEDEVYVDEIIGVDDNSNYIYSPISGIFSKECEINTTNGVRKAIMIENNFKDKRKKTFASFKSIYSMKKDEILELLNKFNKEFKSPIKLKVFYKKSFSSDGILFEEYIEEILELLDVLNTSFKKEVYIYVKSTDMHSIYALSKYKESYPNIKVIYDDRKVKEYINVFDFINIYFILKSKRFLNNKYITIITKKKTYNIKVKLYTKIIDILKYLGITEYKNITLISKDNVELKYNANIIDKDLIGMVIK